jgi:predicted dehydrogenase
MTMGRRTFVGGAMTAASALRVAGANDRIRLGIMGVGNRGTYLAQAAAQEPGTEFVAVCDVWDFRRDRTEKQLGKPAAKYADYRKVLEHKDIDAVIIAVWDHMHCAMAVDACQAGKDVFLEKPMTLHPMEGHQIVKAVRDNRRILQVGTQQRTYPHFIEAKERFVDSGLLGRVNMVCTLWNANRAYRHYTPAPCPAGMREVWCWPPGMEKKPDGLDWDLCRGVLPKVPWNPKHYFNHYVYWDYSCNMTVGGCFVHLVDVVHWYLNITRPAAAVALGGAYLGAGDRDTPDNINVVLEYPEQVLVTFESTVTNLVGKEAVDCVFFGAGGRLSIFRSGYRFVPESGPEVIGRGSPELHARNWLDSIRSRRKPACDEIAGHYSAMACHIANLAYRERRLVRWKEEWTV